MSGSPSEDGPNRRAREVTRYLGTCLESGHLARTGTIAVVIGSWLTLFNHGDALLAAGLDTLLIAKVGLNYLTPFVVANLGLLSRRQ